MSSTCWLTHFVHLFIHFFVRFLDQIPSDVLDHFREAAERLVEEKGAVDAVAAALAQISGTTEIKSRSLLTSQEGLFMCLLVS